jgi:arylsulfatase A-like enzyme
MARLCGQSKGGLPPAEVTLAESLKTGGYATAHIGKWHLGIHEGSLPQDQGFDETFGLDPSENAASPPIIPKCWHASRKQWIPTSPPSTPCRSNWTNPPAHS